MIEERIRNEQLRRKVTSADEAVKLIESGMAIAASGSTREISEALVRRAKQRADFTVDVWSGLVGLDMDRILGEAGLINRRIGQQTLLRSQINNGEVVYSEMRINKFYGGVRRRDWGSLDVAIASVSAITEEGNLVPTTALVGLPNFVEAADKVIVRLSPFYPLEMEGMHDVYISKDPFRREPVPLSRVDERIGSPFVPVEADKIASIVVSDTPDATLPKQIPSEVDRQMAQNIISFLEHEVSLNRLPPNLLPIEIGIGGVNEALLEALSRSKFTNIELFSAALGDGVLDLIDRGKVRAVSATSFLLSDEGEKRLFRDINKYKKFVVLRPVEIADSPELIARLGLIAFNGVIEVDIYGHANATHIGGSRVINGIGGLGEFAENAYLSIIMLPSTTRGGMVSSVVPMVTHVDVTEHSVDIIITEQGVADLRGLSPKERAEQIIQNCAHPDYQPLLRDYLDKAVSKVGMHEPHLLEESFAFHQRLASTKTMRMP